MPHVPPRKLIKHSRQSHNDVREILQVFFVGELLSRSRCLWLVSPWLSDIRVIDNRSGAFGLLNASWGRREIYLAETLAGIISLGGQVVVVTRPDPRNDHFLRRLRRQVEGSGYADRLMIDSQRSDLHLKGLLGDVGYLAGSMNFTYHGLELLEEGLSLETDQEIIASLRLQYRHLYGGVVSHDNV